MSAMPKPAPDIPKLPRQLWMAILARAACAELEALVEREGGLPAHQLLKAPESGTVMVEGRAGGTGVRFNMGEATATRCILRLEDGRMGVSYALGRDTRKALFAAVIDAWLQGEAPGLRHAVEALGSAQRAAREAAARKAAATKVDFFTLVRGE